MPLKRTSQRRRSVRRATVSTDRRFRTTKDLSDTGPMERWQHSGRILELTEHAGVLMARATEEHVVDIMVARRILDDRQRIAAMKFKMDYQRAGLAAHVTGSYTPIRRGKDAFHQERERNDVEEAAYQRWRNAIRGMGLSFSQAVISLACHDMQPATHEVAALQKGLEKLVDWYGIGAGG